MNYRQIAAIHVSSIKTGFLSILGNAFLSSLYKAIDRCPYSILIIKKNAEGTIIGFITGTASVKKMYQWIIFHKGLSFFLQLIPLAFKPSFLKRIIETLLYSQRQTADTAQVVSLSQGTAELLSMAVIEEARGIGIGAALVKELEQFFNAKGIKKYKVVTFSEDKRSNNFYQKNGFKLYTVFIHHENSMHEYCKDIE